MRLDIVRRGLFTETLEDVRSVLILDDFGQPLGVAQQLDRKDGQETSAIILPKDPRFRKLCAVLGIRLDAAAYKVLQR
jgi:hypothetical protein